MRINKALALAKITSRRGAEKLIIAGRITLNGNLVTDLATKVQKGDILCLDGKHVAIPFDEPTYTYVILNKPIEYISTCSDPQKRRTVLSLLPKTLQKEKLYPIGRLDFYSEGLLLLTNDGDLTYSITHPKHHIPKQYVVTVRTVLSHNNIPDFSAGMHLSTGEYLAPMQFHIQNVEHNKSTFYLTLHQGINRQIRKICKELHWPIIRLERIRIGALSLYDLNIHRGSYTIVTKEFLLQRIFSR